MKNKNDQLTSDIKEEEKYENRVRKIFQMLDVRMAFVTSSQLKQALHFLKENQHQSDEQKLQSQEYQSAMKIKRAIIHPDTNKPVFSLLRVSMIVPMNLLLDTGMILANSTKSTVFWQWLNQTYNALHYYANRNATNDDSAFDRIAAYIGATASSLMASLGVRRYAASLGSVPYASVVARLAPFAAVAAADLLNLSLMRQSEYMKGINIYDENGEFVGKSRRCGFFAVSSCIAGRIFAAAPILVLPPLVISQLEQMNTFKSRPWVKLPTMLMLVGIAIQFSVPVTFGLFRQNAQVNVKYLEKDFQNKNGIDGKSIEVVTYNKGL